MTTSLPESGPIRVAIVDDQQLVRAGFAMVINSQPDMEVVLEAGDGAQAVRLLAHHEADVVLMDVRMPHMDGIAATQALIGGGSERSDAPDMKVVILTTFDLDEYVLAAIRAGASGFLLKDAPPEDMLTAIRTIHRGEAVIAPTSTKRLLEHVASAMPAPKPSESTALDSLTEREREVLLHMAKGLSNSEIAAKLFVAEATVKTHVGRVLSKIGARDRVQAVVVAYESGLVQPGSM